MTLKVFLSSHLFFFWGGDERDERGGVVKGSGGEVGRGKRREKCVRGRREREKERRGRGRERERESGKERQRSKGEGERALLFLGEAHLFLKEAFGHKVLRKDQSTSC